MSLSRTLTGRLEKERRYKPNLFERLAVWVRDIKWAVKELRHSKQQSDVHEVVTGSLTCLLVCASSYSLHQWCSEQSKFEQLTCEDFLRGGIVIATCM